MESPGTIGTTKKRSAKSKNAHARESILRKAKAFKRVVVIKERSKGCRWVGGGATQMRTMGRRTEKEGKNLLGSSPK